MRLLKFGNSIENHSLLGAEKDEADVWIFDKRLFNLNPQQYLTPLTNNESKILYSKDKILSRWFLKEVLSIYVQMAPNEIHISHEKTGKPFLKQKGINKLSFNLSHSNNIFICAVSSNKEIGVDVEAVQPIKQMYEIISRFFSKKEERYLLSLPENERITEFLWYWTAKEAYLKATGDGISKIEFIEITRKKGVLKITNKNSNNTCKNLHLFSFIPSPEYCANVVTYQR